MFNVTVTLPSVFDSTGLKMAVNDQSRNSIAIGINIITVFKRQLHFLDSVLGIFTNM